MLLEQRHVHVRATGGAFLRLPRRVRRRAKPLLLQVTVEAKNLVFVKVLPAEDLIPNANFMTPVDEAVTMDMVNAKNLVLRSLARGTFTTHAFDASTSSGRTIFF
jgi:hypothetical protein